MPRKKPFSGKQKKEQLKDKKRRRAAGEEDEENHVGKRHDSAVRGSGRRGKRRGGRDKGNHDHEASRPSHNAGGFGPKNSLCTVFERESRAEVQRRIEDSVNPLQYVNDPECLDFSRASDDYIRLPERPPWDYSMKKEQIDQNEQEVLKNWLESVYSHDRSTLNHFEHNLEVWRQLWRVCEMSEILVVVVDVRHPLIHFPRSLYDYVTGSLRKPMVVVFNKIDIVPASHVERWLAYFRVMFPNVTAIAFTSRSLSNNAKMQQFRKNRSGMKKRWHAVGGQALLEACIEACNAHMSSMDLRSDINWERALEEVAKTYTEEFNGNVESQPAQEPAECSESSEDSHGETALEGDRSDEEEEEEEEEQQEEQEGDEEVEERSTTEAVMTRGVDDSGSDDDDDSEGEEDRNADHDDEEDEYDCSELEEEPQAGSHDGEDNSGRAVVEHDKKYITIGMIGHPNVGKSSIINGLKGRKVVSTSRTPGHTKHFQTIFISEHVRLCDCPGLVFPILGMPRELQPLVGTYPIAQVREVFTPVRYVAERVDLPKLYGLSLDVSEMEQGEEEPRGKGGARGRRRGRKRQQMEELCEKPTASAKVSAGQWSPFLICERYAVKRGYYTSKGRPEAHRAGREILRDVLDGKVPLRFSPPQLGDVA